MHSTQGAKSAESPGAVFFALVTIVSAIAFEMLVSRVAEVVRADGWTLELLLMAFAAGLGFAYLWIGYSTLSMAVGVAMAGRDMVALLVGAVVSFVIIQLIDSVASVWLLGAGALAAVSSLSQNFRASKQILRAPRPV
jgi:hypothetical protein